MSDIPIWTWGKLAQHRRGKMLLESAQATPAETLNDKTGVVLAFGHEFQEIQVNEQENWIHWTHESGRTLLLVPPFASGVCQRPLSWEAKPFEGAQLQPDSVLKNTLAKEVRYELCGKLQVAREVEGVWADNRVHTGFFRKHPLSGIFAVTCLPLWSMVFLDSKKELLQWLHQLHQLAGKPVAKAEITTSFELRPAHYTLLLHSISGSFSSKKETLAALAASPVFQLEMEIAASAFDELEGQGLIAAGVVTQRGLAVVAESPYAAYANALFSLKTSN
ncbi:MAG: hypothetical protein K1Y36_21680 [Blastocatellia bacterium]|nr:hypothetical protein [Blastocatellia bacterium]